MILRALLLLLPILPSDSSNILIIPEWDSSSHIWSMLPYALSLQSAGHNVTFLDVNTLDKPRTYPEGIGLIHLSITEAPGAHSPIGELMWSIQWRGWTMWKSYRKAEEAFKTTLEAYSEVFKEVISKHWDFLIVDVMTNNAGYYLSSELSKRDVSYSVFMTSSMFYSHSIVNALGRDPTSRMSMFTTLPESDYRPYDGTRFWQRLDQTVDSLLEYATLVHWAPRYLTSYHSLTGHPFSWEQLMHGAAFFATDNLDEFGHPQPEAQHIISAGAHCPSSDLVDKPLPEEIGRFVEDPESQGTIYVAFGSILNWNYASNETRSIFRNALNSLRQYRILFVYPLDDLQFDSHVMVLRWAPQSAVLAHPRTVAFLSHGGMKSLRESLCALVPSVILPFFAEQAQNARLMRERQLVLALHKKQLTAERVAEALTEVASNPRFKSALSRHRSLYLDHPIPELRRAVLWAERAVRVGTKRIRPLFRGVEQSWLRFLHIDILTGLSWLVFVLIA